MKRIMIVFLIFSSCYSIYKTASPEMIPNHALVKEPIEILGKQKFGPLYLVLLREGKREEAIRLAMPLSYEGFIESFYHGPLRELEVSIDEALSVLQKSERPKYSGSFLEDVVMTLPVMTEFYRATVEDEFEQKAQKKYGPLFYAYCRLSYENYNQTMALKRLKAAHEAGETLVFSHQRNFERKKEKITFPAREIPLK